MTTLQPLLPHKRDQSLDMLRGFALAGVLFVFCTGDLEAPKNHVNTLLDEIIVWPKWILVENRMYNMLILIFGIGFSVQVNKAMQKQESLVPVFVRRLTGLLIIGFLHAILLSNRDILIFYGLAGFALLPARNFSNRQLLVFMILVFLILISPVIDILFKSPWQEIKTLREPNDLWGHLRYNWIYFKEYHQLYAVYVDMLAHFLLGFYIGRISLLQKIQNDKKFRNKIFLVAFISSMLLGPMEYAWADPIAYTAVYKMNIPWQKFLANTGLRFLWQLWMLASVALYISILIYLWVNRKTQEWLKPLGKFGQIALSNYLIQSIILVPYALLFNKFGNTPPFEGFILFLIVLVLQLLFSSWWLKRFRLGPFEWLLRSFTYFKWQPLKN